MATLVGVAAVSLVADFGARAYAENRAVAALEKRIPGARGVEVAIDEWPFLVGALNGSVDVMRVDAARAEKDEVRVTDIELRLRDVTFDIGTLIGGTGRVEVGRGDGEARVDLEIVERALSQEGVEADLSIDGGVLTILVAGAPRTEISLDAEGDTLVLEGGGIPPLELELPSLGRGISYGGAAVGEDDLVLELTLRRATFRI